MFIFCSETLAWYEYDKSKGRVVDRDFSDVLNDVGTIGLVKKSRKDEIM